MCECPCPTPNEFPQNGSAVRTRVLLKIFLSCSIVKMCRGPLVWAEASQRSVYVYMLTCICMIPCVMWINSHVLVYCQVYVDSHVNVCFLVSYVYTAMYMYTLK